MKKIVFFTCSIFVAGGFMFLGVPGKPEKSAYTGNDYRPEDPAGYPQASSGIDNKAMPIIPGKEDSSMEAETTITQ